MAYQTVRGQAAAAERPFETAKPDQPFPSSWSFIQANSPEPFSLHLHIMAA
jgi:hypothetical protein